MKLQLSQVDQREQLGDPFRFTSLSSEINIRLHRAEENAADNKRFRVTLSESMFFFFKLIVPDWSCARSLVYTVNHSFHNASTHKLRPLFLMKSSDQDVNTF